ncbi:methyl-accepting chemotaxis protein [Aeromonas veronii]
MKTSKRHFSIIQRIALGFLTIILLLILSVGLSLYTGQRLAAQVNELTGHTAPTLVQSRAVTRDLFSLDKSLRVALLQPSVEDIDKAIALMQQWQQSYQQDALRLKEQTNRDADLQEKVSTLDEQQSQYWALIKQLATDYATNLSHQQTLSRDNRLDTAFRKLRGQLDILVAPLGAHPAVLTKNQLLQELELQTSSVTDSLKQRDPQLIASKAEQLTASAVKLAALRKQLAVQLRTQESAFGGYIDLEQSAGTTLDNVFTLLSGPQALLAKHLELSMRSEQLRNQSEQATRMVDSLLAELSAIDDIVDAQLSARVSQSQGILLQLEIGLSVGLLVSLCLSALILLHLIRAIRKPMQQLLTTLLSLSRGDMTQRAMLDRHDELGQVGKGINSLAHEMSNMLSQVVHAARSLGEMAELNLSAQQSATRQLEQQRSETNSVCAAMEEMDYSAREVATSAEMAEQTLAQVAKEATQTSMMSQHTAERMSRLADDLTDSRHAIESVHHLSVNIGGILEIIERVTEQTNLLALNAAIEAARAGEHGRGFAVVADEVRQLARHTAESTTQIQSHIAALQQGVTGAVETIVRCHGVMQACSQDSQQTRMMLGTLSDSLHSVAELSSRIATAALQQRQTSTEIARNISNISSIANENQKVLGNVAHTGGQLQKLSSQQQSLVQRFVLQNT